MKPDKIRYRLKSDTVGTQKRKVRHFINLVIITSAIIINGQEYSFHHNVLITNNTTFEEYYEQVYEYIDTHYDDDNLYGIDVIPCGSLTHQNAWDILKSNSEVQHARTGRHWLWQATSGPSRAPWRFQLDFVVSWLGAGRHPQVNDRGSSARMPLERCMPLLESATDAELKIVSFFHSKHRTMSNWG